MSALAAALKDPQAGVRLAEPDLEACRSVLRASVVKTSSTACRRSRTSSTTELSARIDSCSAAWTAGLSQAALGQCGRPTERDQVADSTALRMVTRSVGMPSMLPI